MTRLGEHSLVGTIKLTGDLPEYFIPHVEQLLADLFRFYQPPVPKRPGKGKGVGRDVTPGCVVLRWAVCGGQQVVPAGIVAQNFRISGLTDAGKKNGCKQNPNASKENGCVRGHRRAHLSGCPKINCWPRNVFR